MWCCNGIWVCSENFLLRLYRRLNNLFVTGHLHRDSASQRLLRALRIYLTTPVEAPRFSGKADVFANRMFLVNRVSLNFTSQWMCEYCIAITIMTIISQLEILKQNQIVTIDATNDSDSAQLWKWRQQLTPTRKRFRNQSVAFILEGLSLQRVFGYFLKKLWLPNCQQSLLGFMQSEQRRCM